MSERESIALGLGVLGAGMNALWPLFRSRRGMLAAQMAGTACFTAHFVLLGAVTGAWMNALALVQAGLAIPLDRKPGLRTVYLLTLPVIAAVLVASWAGPASALAGLGFALVSVGRYQLREVPFRALLLLAVPAWVGHNLVVGSVPGLISDGCAFVAGAAMLGRALRTAEPRG